MRKKRGVLCFLVFAGLWVSSAAQLDSLRDLFRSLSVYSAADQAPSYDQIGQLVSTNLPKTSTDELQELVPFVRKCLTSTNPGVRTAAILYLFGLHSARADGTGRLLEPYSARLLEPYEDILIAMLDRDDRRGAIYLLGIEFPRPSSRALAALYGHLNDERYSTDEFDMLSGALLAVSPTMPSVVHAVLAGAKERLKNGVDDRIIQTIGLSKITDPEALAYVREGFREKDRIAPVEAIGRMPSEIRSQFVNELRSVAQDPEERPETRAEAQQILMQR